MIEIVDITLAVVVFGTLLLSVAKALPVLRRA